MIGQDYLQRMRIQSAVEEEQNMSCSLVQEVDTHETGAILERMVEKQLRHGQEFPPKHLHSVHDSPSVM